MLEYLEDALNVAVTENGANAVNTTESKVLDLFALGGAFRNTPVDIQQRLFVQAWNENPELTLKVIFHLRDVRHGQGQRCGFENQLIQLANSELNTLIPLLPQIPEFGRWDDLYHLIDTPAQNYALALMKSQFENDLISIEKGETISLLGKWLKSENASSPKTKKLAKITRKYFKLNSKQYRQDLSKLRGFLNIVERKMTSGDWSDIEYSKVPSQAMMNYKNAFYKNDLNRYEQYIAAVSSGESKVNAATLYPYQVVHDVFFRKYNSHEEIDNIWNALPDYVGRNYEESIAVVDVSMSMNGTPVEVAVSIGLYLAERNTGLYKNKFITFSEKPDMQTIVDGSIVSKIMGIKKSNWGYSTNIERVFDLVLQAAIDNELAASKMIKKIYIISDMQFDNACNDKESNDTLFQNIQKRFEESGYQCPKLVFWNVDARKNDQFPMKMTDFGVQMVSGFSPVIFKNLMNGFFLSAYEMMLDIVESERYESITIERYETK